MDTLLFKCWTTVWNAGPALKQQWVRPVQSGRHDPLNAHRPMWCVQSMTSTARSDIMHVASSHMNASRICLTSWEPNSRKHNILIDTMLLSCWQNHLRRWHSINPWSSSIQLSTHLKMCLATAIHNFKRVKIIHNFVFWKQTFTIIAADLTSI